MSRLLWALEESNDPPFQVFDWCFVGLPLSSFGDFE